VKQAWLLSINWPVRRCRDIRVSHTAGGHGEQAQRQHGYKNPAG
jgi:hypothetical protein